MVLVGVDGSGPAQDALRYALRDGARRNAAVTVVRVVPSPTWVERSYASSDPVSLVLPALPESEVRAQVERETRQLIDDVRAEDPAFGRVAVTLRVVTGDPAQVLVEAAKEADLLVVGHRGRGGVVGGLIGSVGLKCVFHSTVPVTIVRPTPSRS